jgi:hypothetical protein
MFFHFYDAMIKYYRHIDESVISAGGVSFIPIKLSRTTSPVIDHLLYRACDDIFRILLGFNISHPVQFS